MKKKREKRGGKRVAGPGKSIGRPRKDNAKVAVFAVAVSHDELELLRCTDARSWARDVLLRSAKRRTMS
jgi:hypothetical protein